MVGYKVLVDIGLVACYRDVFVNCCTMIPYICRNFFFNLIWKTRYSIIKYISVDRN